MRSIPRSGWGAVSEQGEKNLNLMSHAHGGSKEEEENEPVAVPASWLSERFRLPRAQLMLMIEDDVGKGLLPDPDTARARVRLDGRHAVGEQSKKPEENLAKGMALLVDLSGHGT